MNYLLALFSLGLIACAPSHDGNASASGGEAGATRGDGGQGQATSGAGGTGNESKGGAAGSGGVGSGGAAGSGGAVDSSPGGQGFGGGLETAALTARPLGSTQAAQGYQEYLPSGYGDGALRPLIVFVHGLGENGNGTTELSKVLDLGIGKVLSQGQWPASRPFIVLAPQHQPSATASGFDCTTADELHDFISYALAHYEVDPSRVYLAGLSCGAIGSWRYLGQYVDQQVAAAVLVAGDGRSAWEAKQCQLARVGIWAFHGLLDGTVPPEGSTQPLASLMACPQPRKDQRLTTYAEIGHESWVPTYEQPDSPNDIYAWMLGIRR